jgi:hypothetical protein
MSQIPDSISAKDLTLLSLTAKHGLEPIMNEDTRDTVTSLLVALEAYLNELEAMSFPELTSTRSQHIVSAKRSIKIAIRNLKKAIKI